MKEAGDKRTNMIPNPFLASRPPSRDPHVPARDLHHLLPRQAHFSHSEERTEPVSAQEPSTVTCIETKRTSDARARNEQLSISWTKAETSRDR